MKSIIIKIKKNHKDAKLPTRGSKNALCYDLYCVLKKPIKMSPNTSYLFNTGIIMEFPEGWGCMLWDRSGMGAKRNIHRLAGVIDQDYRGEIIVSLINLSSEDQIINPGDKIIQAHFVENTNVEFIEVDSLEDTERGSKGFGSTDK